MNNLSSFATNWDVAVRTFAASTAMWFDFCETMSTTTHPHTFYAINFHKMLPNKIPPKILGIFVPCCTYIPVRPLKWESMSTIQFSIVVVHQVDSDETRTFLGEYSKVWLYSQLIRNCRRLASSGLEETTRYINSMTSTLLTCVQCDVMWCGVLHWISLADENI